MSRDDLTRIADELYSAPFADFTSARNARASEAAAAGDRGLADEIRALSKPSVAAWALNVLLRGRPGALSDLAALRRRIESATVSGDREALRAAARDRHRTLAELVADAERRADADGKPLSASVVEQVTDALAAALGDPIVADALATRRLVVAPGPGGLDLPAVRRLVAVPPETLGGTDTDDPDADLSDDDGGPEDGPAEASASAGLPERSGSHSPARKGLRSSGAGRRKVEREARAAEVAAEEAREDRSRRERRRDDLVATRDEADAERRRLADELRRAERAVDDADDAVRAAVADIRSRELDWKRAESTAKRLRRRLEETTDADDA